jgi:hypothetical protein
MMALAVQEVQAAAVHLTKTTPSMVATVVLLEQAEDKAVVLDEQVA